MFTHNPSAGLDPCLLFPQAVDMENAVIGAVLLESKVFPEVEGILSAADFYSERNKAIFAAASSLGRKRQPVDVLTVMEELKLTGKAEEAGGYACLAELMSGITSSAHVIRHAQIVKQKSVARQIILLASAIQRQAYDETADIADVMESLEKAVTEINMSSVSGIESLSMPAALKKPIDTAWQTQTDRQSGKMTSVPTGLYCLDDELEGGWHTPDLIIIGARPSMGKTQHALSFAKTASSAGADCMFASIEMTAVQLVNRYLLEDTRINSYNLRSGQMSTEEWAAVDERSASLSGMRLHIADNHNIRYLSNIKSEARRLHRRGSLKLLVIDYLQLICTNMKFQNRHLEIGHITKELKNLAKELDIPVILLSQLSRPEKGTVKEPVLSDLKESGEIENDADIVLFIHKPDYYDAQAKDKQGVPWKGRGKLIVSKNRQGIRNQTVLFYHDDRYKKIFDYKQYPATQGQLPSEHRNEDADKPF